MSIIHYFAVKFFSRDLASSISFSEIMIDVKMITLDKSIFLKLITFNKSSLQ